jgi:SH3 domain-containing YSC84-like protein 1
MRTSPISIGLLMVQALVLRPTPSAGQVREAATVEAAGQVLREIMAIPAWQIPASLLSDAQGIVIVPNVLKGSFVLGVRHGRGVALVRDENGQWRAPTFLTLTGGSIGYQAGVQATDVILVFKTRNSVQGLLGGKFTLGADAAVAAGPVGRQAAAATDTALKAEIYSYSRTRGLFAGVCLDGSALRIDSGANAIYYAAVPGGAPGQPAPVPPSAVSLVEQVSKYAPPPANVQPAVAVAPVPGPVAGPANPVAITPDLRQELADAARRLNAVLDDNWRTYLALPAEVYGGDRQPGAAALEQPLRKFNLVAADPQYRLLTQRIEFQAAHECLQRYATSLAPRNAPTLALPPPPR